MLRRENRIVNGKIILDDTYNKQEIWDNKQARCLFNFPINDRSKQERRLPGYELQGSRLTGQLSSRRRGLTPTPVADVALFPYKMSPSKILILASRLENSTNVAVLHTR